MSTVMQYKRHHAPAPLTRTKKGGARFGGANVKKWCGDSGAKKMALIRAISTSFQNQIWQENLNFNATYWTRRDTQIIIFQLDYF